MTGRNERRPGAQTRPKADIHRNRSSGNEQVDVRGKKVPAESSKDSQLLSRRRGRLAGPALGS